MRLNTRLAAEYLGISPQYLRNMRQGQHSHEGPDYERVPHVKGNECLYEVKTLDAWKSKHPFRTWARGFERVQTKGKGK